MEISAIKDKLSYNLPGVKKAKTEKELAFALFDYGEVRIIFELFSIQQVKKYFEEWKEYNLNEANKKLGRTIASGNSKRISNATNKKNELSSLIESNEGLINEAIAEKKRKNQQRKKKKEKK